MFGNLFNQQRGAQGQQQPPQPNNGPNGGNYPNEQYPPQQYSDQQMQGNMNQPNQPSQNQSYQQGQPIPAQGQQSTPAAGVANSTMDPARRQDLSALSHLDSRTQKVLTHAQQETMRI